MQTVLIISSVSDTQPIYQKSALSISTDAERFIKTTYSLMVCDPPPTACLLLVYGSYSLSVLSPSRCIKACSDWPQFLRCKLGPDLKIVKWLSYVYSYYYCNEKSNTSLKTSFIVMLSVEMDVHLHFTSTVAGFKKHTKHHSMFKAKVSDVRVLKYAYTYFDKKA